MRIFSHSLIIIQEKGRILSDLLIVDRNLYADVLII